MKRITYIVLVLLTMCTTVSCDKDIEPDVLASIFLGSNDEYELPLYRQYVDLGLSVKWGRYNIGEKEEHLKSLYFCYGETSTKRVYTESNYQYSKGTVSRDVYYMTKYCDDSNYGNYDGLRRLEKDDDAATSILGKAWRIPTKAEIEELITNCSWNRATEDGVLGVLGTSKINGNTIFIPAAGYVYNSRIYGKDELIVFQSSDLSAGRQCQGNYIFEIDMNEKKVKIDDAGRYLGIPVRGVYTK